ncbi:5-oxoprolinase subunit PxpB [Niallia endozanthoxylica]|uniref:5-oxoprolinase subunit PxpB n=1 Tax=Niallia endozanthoxylica TaxID=2036016 RepID=A0A5J5HYZ1_9BACI|nr:5-oxoprolinase subunit PxpB [Niallia endozanthoxylica]KAA9028372.1 5-oxoprolinase subunit PxpB [Niallia endozanthoxylica]
MNYKLFPLGDQGIIIELGKDISAMTHQKVQNISFYLQNHPFEWMVEYIPSFTTVTIYYHPLKIERLTQGRIHPYQYACEQLNNLLSSIALNQSFESRTIEIPVCYGGEYGPDIEIIAELNHLTPEEVIQIHTSSDYLVYMIGFVPGFPYLGGMSERIAAPRRKTPRLQIPARSVGIAGSQTGIYPLETPGGWQIIGRTPVSLFRPDEEPPTLLKAGDRVKFTSISSKEFKEREARKNHDYNY